MGDFLAKRVEEQPPCCHKQFDNMTLIWKHPVQARLARRQYRRRLPEFVDEPVHERCRSPGIDGLDQPLEELPSLCWRW